MRIVLRLSDKSTAQYVAMSTSHDMSEGKASSSPLDKFFDVACSAIVSLWQVVGLKATCLTFVIRPIHASKNIFHPKHNSESYESAFCRATGTSSIS